MRPTTGIAPFRPTVCQLIRRFGTSLYLVKMDAANLPPEFLPPVNRSMTSLDKGFFRKTIPVAAAWIKDVKKTSDIRRKLVKVDSAPVLRGLREDPDVPGARCMVLHPRVRKDDPTTWSPVLRSLEESGDVQLQDYQLELTYDDWSMHSILDAILPERTEGEHELPAGYSQVGHVAHLNLRKQYLPYKHLIAQVLVDKNPAITTVVNKLLKVGIESAFRTFPYEVLVGEDNLDVTVSEDGCEFRFNFGKVYWNPRLGTEHKRLINKFKEGEAVCDVMAGVGPFAVPAGKRNVFVRANDLNPDSFTGLQDAIRRNHAGSFVSASCADGRLFIRESAAVLRSNPRKAIVKPNIKLSRNLPIAEREKLQAQIDAESRVWEEPRAFDHYVMNLPATAVEFLDAFKGLYQGREAEFAPHADRRLPLIHVHLFQAKRAITEEEHKEILETVSHHLGHDISGEYDKDEVELHYVRLVAPNKKMYCASFRLPEAVAFAKPGPV